MTSRERVRTLLSGGVPDRIPSGFGGLEVAGLHVLAYEKLQNLLGLQKTPPRVNTFEMNAVFEMDALRAAESDILLLDSPKLCKSDLWGTGYETQWKEMELWGHTFRVSAKDEYVKQDDGGIMLKSGWNGSGWPVYNRPGSFFFDEPSGSYNLNDTERPDPDKFEMSGDWPDEDLRRLQRIAQEMYESTEFSLCLGEVAIGLSYLSGGWLSGWMTLAEYPDEMREIFFKCAEASLSKLKLLDQAVGAYVDIVNIAHDLGDNRCVFVGAERFREVYKEPYRAFLQGWKKTTGMKCALHSCGAISEILGDLSECGLEIYNPVQISGANMAPDHLKAKFGNLIFWGGAYDHHLCNPGESYESIYTKTAANIKALAKNGGFIFAGVHNLLPEIPEHHLKAMLDAFRDNRDYVINAKEETASA